MTFGLRQLAPPRIFANSSKVFCDFAKRSAAVSAMQLGQDLPCGQTGELVANGASLVDDPHSPCIFPAFQICRQIAFLGQTAIQAASTTDWKSGT